MSNEKKQTRRRSMRHAMPRKKRRRLKLPIAMLFTGGGKDEDRYRHWVEQNQHGYVINYRPDFSWMKLHRATCGSIQMDDLNYTT